MKKQKRPALSYRSFFRGRVGTIIISLVFCEFRSNYTYIEYISTFVKYSNDIKST